MFRLKKWDDPQTYKHNRFNDAHAEPQDILQVWFAGVHADIGGGYPEKESGLSKYPLLWMIDEARKCGLQGQPGHRQPARLGHPAQGQPVLLCRARRARRPAHLAVGRVVAARISAEEREVQGMAGAESVFRLVHPGRRAAPDSGWRDHPRIRDPAHGRDAELPAGELAEAVRDVSDADAARAWRERGRCGGGGSVSTSLPFSPCGRRWREAPDEGSVTAECFTSPACGGGRRAQARGGWGKLSPHDARFVMRRHPHPSPPPHAGEGDRAACVLHPPPQYYGPIPARPRPQCFTERSTLAPIFVHLPELA